MVAREPLRNSFTQAPSRWVPPFWGERPPRRSAAIMVTQHISVATVRSPGTHAGMTPHRISVKARRPSVAGFAPGGTCARQHPGGHSSARPLLRMCQPSRRTRLPRAVVSASGRPSTRGATDASSGATSRGSSSVECYALRDLRRWRARETARRTRTVRPAMPIAHVIGSVAASGAPSASGGVGVAVAAAATAAYPTSRFRAAR